MLWGKNDSNERLIATHSTVKIPTHVVYGLATTHMHRVKVAHSTHTKAGRIKLFCSELFPCKCSNRRQNIALKNTVCVCAIRKNKEGAKGKMTQFVFVWNWNVMRYHYGGKNKSFNYFVCSMSFLSIFFKKSRRILLCSTIFTSLLYAYITAYNSIVLFFPLDITY